MSKRAFDRISEGLRESLAIARGERKPAKWHMPAEIDVRAIRMRLRMTQDDFAAAFGFTTNQIKDWEQNRSRPLGGVRAYLLLIDTDPATVRKLLKSRTARKAA